jgi:hypothetical protein
MYKVLIELDSEKVKEDVGMDWGTEHRMRLEGRST